MSLYLDLIEAVSIGKKIHINLVEKTVKVNGKEINLDKTDLIDITDMEYVRCNLINPWEIIEELYGNYKRSIPSATVLTNKPYFKADSVEDLTDMEMAFNMNRNEAQVILEGYVLLAGLSGWFTWEYDKHWFWQGTDKELVVLREWI